MRSREGTATMAGDPVLLPTLSHPVLQITEGTIGKKEKEKIEITGISKKTKKNIDALACMYINPAWPGPIRIPACISSSSFTNTSWSSRVANRSAIGTRLHVVNQSTHLKCSGFSASHSSIVRHRTLPWIMQRIFGKYGFFCPPGP